MNKELFDSMQKQMSPSPQVRAELSEKLAQPVKKRPAAWKKYTAVAACAALVIGALGASRYPSWELPSQYSGDPPPQLCDGGRSDRLHYREHYH